MSKPMSVSPAEQTSMNMSFHVCFLIEVSIWDGFMEVYINMAKDMLLYANADMFSNGGRMMFIYL
jgi:hypothetical protein